MGATDAHHPPSGNVDRRERRPPAWAPIRRPTRDQPGGDCAVTERAARSTGPPRGKAEAGEGPVHGLRHLSRPVAEAGDGDPRGDTPSVKDGTRPRLTRWTWSTHAGLVADRLVTTSVSVRAKSERITRVVSGPGKPAAMARAGPMVDTPTPSSGTRRASCTATNPGRVATGVGATSAGPTSKWTTPTNSRPHRHEWPRRSTAMAVSSYRRPAGSVPGSRQPTPSRRRGGRGWTAGADRAVAGGAGGGGDTGVEVGVVDIGGGVARVTTVRVRGRVADRVVHHLRSDTGRR